MSTQAVYEYLIAILGRYQQGNKKIKTELLNEAIKVTCLSRKQLIRRLKKPETLKTQGSRSGRPPLYQHVELEPIIKFLWIQMERISPRRMKEALPEWLPFYEDCPAHLKYQLTEMSASTLGRVIQSIRGGLDIKRGLSTTCPARFMKNNFPINTFDQNITQPGHMQADTVAHCGTSSLGPFINTLTLTDIFSGWTENRAIHTKKATIVRKTIANMEKKLPFKILSINFDSGSEFINTEMLNYGRTDFGGKRIHLTRSRPYKKNDNCYVEQKNHTHVRELFGYDRFEDPELTLLMDEIYIYYWGPLQNFFLPHFKLKEKIRVGSKIKKKYDKPQTSYKRVLDSKKITEEEEAMLIKQKQSLNPFELKKGLESKLKEFFTRLRQSQIREAA